MSAQDRIAARVSFRLFAEGDLPAVERVRDAAYRPVFQSFRDLTGPEIAGIAFARSDADHASYLLGLCAPEAGRHMHVVELDGALIGFFSYGLNETTKLGEIGLNGVHPDFAGRGVGARMYAFILERMREAGMKAVEVGAGGDASHAAARRAYAKAGFGAPIPSVTYYRTL
jgi:GNAT superfamily N-acetyltransferase